LTVASRGCRIAQQRPPAEYARQQELPFGQRQTYVANIVKTIGAVELHDVEAERLTIDPGSNQP
jgi:hypothetical protein